MSAPGSTDPDATRHAADAPQLADAGEGLGRLELALLLFAVALAALRFLGLSTWGLWFDEALSWGAYANATDYDPWTYPFWYAAHAFVLDLLGEPSERNLRLLPATMGALSVLATWWGLRPLTGGRASALAAVVLGVSTWHLYLSQTARPYTTALALGMVGAGLALRATLAGRLPGFLAGLGVSALAVGFHPVAAIGVGGLLAACWALRQPRLNLLQAVLSAGVILLAGAAFPPVAEAIGLHIRLRPSTAHFVLAFGFHVGPLTLAAAGVGVLLALRRADPRRAALFQAVLVMLVAALSLSLFVRVTARYVLWVVPWIAALAALPFFERSAEGGEHAGRAGFLRGAGLAALVLPQLVNVGLYYAAWNGSRPYWREAFQYVDAQRAEGEPVIGVAGLLGQYYLGRDTPEVTAVHDLVYWRDAIAELDPETRAWIVVRPEELEDWSEDSRAAVQELLRTRCRHQRTFLNVPTMGRNLTLEVYVTDPGGGVER